VVARVEVGGARAGGGEEPLRLPRTRAALHPPFPLVCRLVRTLRALVAPPVLPVGLPHLHGSSADSVQQDLE